MNVLNGQLAQVDQQTSTGELLFMALGPLILGLLMFLFGLMGERANVIKPGIKWLALVPLIIGIVMGWDYFKKVTGPEGDTFVMLNMIAKKKILYQAAFVLPVLGTIALPIWAILANRRAEDAGYVEEEEVLDEDAADAGYPDEEYTEEEYEEGPFEEDEVDEQDEGEHHDPKVR